MSWKITFYPEPPDDPSAYLIGVVLVILVALGAIYGGYTSTPTCPCTTSQP